MKKILVLLMLLSVAFTSCSTDQQEPIQEEQNEKVYVTVDDLKLYADNFEGDQKKAILDFVQLMEDNQNIRTNGCAYILGAQIYTIWQTPEGQYYMTYLDMYYMVYRHIPISPMSAAIACGGNQ